MVDSSHTIASGSGQLLVYRLIIGQLELKLILFLAC